MGRLMKGYHKVKTFTIKHEEEVDLPEGWKLFAVEPTFGGFRIVAQKWERTGE